jgi:hypothetical protein
MKAKGKVKKQKHSKGGDVDNIFQKKEESVQDALKRIITREHQQIVEKEKKNLTAAPAKVMAIEKEEPTEDKPKTDYSWTMKDFLFFDGVAKLQSFFNLFDEDSSGLREIGETLLRDIWNEIETFCELVEARIGKIEVDRKDYARLGWIGREITDVRFTPVKQAKGA